jgi:branched-chain amino acid aminotransferase
MSKAKTVGQYTNSVLAKLEAKRAGYDEALLLDTEGYVSEGSGENIFMLKGNVLKTTPLTSILSGITRDSVITIAKEEGLEIQERRFTRDELYCADEVFFTGTAAEMTPIREIDDRKIGDGKPGPVVEQLNKRFMNIVHGQDSRHGAWLTYV